MESDERREIIKIYWQQYLLLEKRMIELSDYVAIDRKNYATFSNQFISMYLIICSEIDSVADEYCKRFLEQDKKNTFGITNKINLILHEYPKLQDWRCQTKFPYGEIDLVPFKKFKDNESSDWWKSYNSVKHNRTEKDEKEHQDGRRGMYAPLGLCYRKLRQEYGQRRRESSAGRNVRTGRRFEG